MQQDQNGQAQKIREDSVAKKRLDSAIAEIKAGKNWDSVCAKYSDDPGSKDKGGVFGYFASSGQVDQSFGDSSFEGKKGDKKIVHSVFGFHYIEILDQKGSEPAYKFAYFSKPILESQATDDSVREEASKFSASVTGSNSLKLFYDNAAKIKKTPMQVPGILENNYSLGNPGYPGSLGKGRAFIKWVYQADIGAISDQPYKFGDKYIVAVVTAINKPGLISVESARPLVEQKIRSAKKAKQIIETKIKGTTLEAVAQSSGQQVQHADSVYFQSRGRFGSIISSEPSVTGAAFNKLLQGKVSQPIAGVTGVFVIKDNSIAGISTAESNIDVQRKSLEYAMRSQIMQQLQPRQGGISPLQKAADIKDYRSKFF
jgi:peptidyl-prolyl cis-trans isomerase D